MLHDGIKNSDEQEPACGREEEEKDDWYYGNDPDYRDRTLFYWAKLYSSELKSGEDYSELKQTITINIINFNMFEGADYHTEVAAMIKGTNEVLRNSIGGYSTIEVVGTRENFNKTSCNYTLMPVWMITYSSGNNNYIFALNGQTGKVFGSLPVSKGKIAILFILVFILVFLGVLVGGMFI